MKLHETLISGGTARQEVMLLLEQNEKREREGRGQTSPVSPGPLWGIPPLLLSLLSFSESVCPFLESMGRQEQLLVFLASLCFILSTSHSLTYSTNVCPQVRTCHCVWRTVQFRQQVSDTWKERERQLRDCMMTSLTRCGSKKLNSFQESWGTSGRFCAFKI